MQCGPPIFKPTEINALFGFLKYPWTIRSDAITAVGAPSNIAFLVKAIYWLYILASSHTPADSQANMINEDDETEQNQQNRMSETVTEHDDTEVNLFKELLDEVLK